MRSQQADIAIVGAGIVGLAHAYAAARRGYKVVLFERTDPAVGASIRNFGLIWPIGQPSGPLFQRALRSREIWRAISVEAGLWCTANGSLHLAYHQDEQDVLVEFVETAPEARELCALLDPVDVAAKSTAVKLDGLRCALWSPSELNVDPRQAIRVIPGWLERTYAVELRFGTIIHGIAMPFIETLTERWQVDRAFVCSGPDFETLYPAAFAQTGITRCKLQMLRTVPQPSNWQLGPSLCAGLTLLHYSAFKHCSSLDALRARLAGELPFYLEHGIHVLLSQTALGELTIGDSHEYGLTHDPFEREALNRAILCYLMGFAQAPTLEIAERWHGIYPIVPGQTEVILHPEPGVTIVNGLGGAGMTLAFGLAEETLMAL
jgi:FAD dependent oxidoreductase TIGR03364